MKKLLLLLSTLSLLINGCAKYNIEANHKFGQEGTSLIYGTLFHEKGNDGFIYLYKKGEEKMFTRLEAVGFDRHLKEFHLGDKQGSLFAVAVPPGEYEIRGWHHYSFWGKTHSIYTQPKTENILSFTVRKNAPVYIGSYNITKKVSKFDKEAILKISNNFNNDKKYLLKKYPTLGTTKSVNQTPKLKTWE